MRVVPVVLGVSISVPRTIQFSHLLFTGDGISDEISAFRKEADLSMVSCIVHRALNGLGIVLHTRRVSSIRGLGYIE